MTSTRDLRIFKYVDIDSSSLNATGSQQPNLQIIEIISKLKPQLYPSSLSDEEKLEITQWLPFSQQLELSDFQFLNNYFIMNSFLSLHKFTIADVAVFESVIELILKKSNSHLPYPNLCRWLELISNYVNAVDKIKSLLVITKSPTLLLVPSGSTTTSATTTSDTAKNQNKATKTPKEVTTADKKEEKPKKEKSTTPASTNSTGTGTSKTTTETNDKNDETNTSEPLDPSKLDIRVGVIVKCWNHADSEKLLCEEIDVGEGNPRSIASGLRAHYTAEEMTGKKVVVLANLKERPMAGFKSQVIIILLPII